MKNGGLILALLVSVSFLTSCKPQTASQKIEDKAEDMSHETKQGMERAQEKVDGKN